MVMSNELHKTLHEHIYKFPMNFLSLKIRNMKTV